MIKFKNIFFILGLILCVGSIALLVIKGSPQGQVNFNSVAEVGEGIIGSVDKIGQRVTAVSVAEEMEIGDKIAQKLMENKVAIDIKNTPLERYVTDVGNLVAENVKRKDIKYKFCVIDEEEPNAGSLPGGHIYITVELLRVLRTESELAAILAHEIVHVDAKHCIGVVQYKVAAQKVLGGGIDRLVDMGYQLFIRPGFSEMQEREADLGATYLLFKAGYHPEGIVYVFERVSKYASLDSDAQGSLTPIGDTLKATGGLIYRYFSSHPLALERIAKIKQYITQRKLMADGSVFYIGQKNYQARVAFSRQKFSDEFKHDYPQLQDVPNQAPAVNNLSNEEIVTQVDTFYGRISSGMSLAEIEAILPAKFRAFKKRTRVGYKKIMIYDANYKDGNYSAGIWIELENNLVREIRLYK